MIKEELSNLRRTELVHKGEGSIIYRLDDKRLLKLAGPAVFNACSLIGVRYEDRILSTCAKSVKEIVSPITAVYHQRNCVGYTMEEVEGPNLLEYDDSLSFRQKGDLTDYARLYEKIEEVVIKANKVGIVFPDLCTLDNIVFCSDGTVKFIDYDGLQVGSRDKSMVLSTSLGDPTKYLMSKKYCAEPFRFTRELDKTSLAMTMFLWVFCVDLKSVGKVIPFSGEKVDVKYLFDFLGIKDEVFMNKIEANMSTTDKGCYLAGDLRRISENYRMIAAPVPGTDMIAKRLIKK